MTQPSEVVGIKRVSSASAETGQPATQVRAETGTVRVAINEMKGAIMQIVRSAAPEAETSPNGVTRLRDAPAKGRGPVQAAEGFLPLAASSERSFQ